ncbi:MAG: hypothetical protein FJ405_19560, partial [Verrucomicrobia bacterium]|nr:hypothetical protein [Verrucomicrobiota bacterium]
MNRIDLAPRPLRLGTRMRILLALTLTISMADAAVRIERLPGPGLQLALGRKGRVHVIWNGSNSATQKPSNGGAPLLYARLQEDGRGFSEQIDLSGKTHELDGGGSIAADGEGRVFVAWHASRPGSSGETNREVFLAVSTDDGGIFAQERGISPPGSGACGCCGLTVLANVRGEVFLLFRTAPTSMQRDMALLRSSDQGTSFRALLSDPWSINQCPMSSAGLTSSG